MDEDAKRVIALLEELREGQKLQLERQLEALELQRRQFAAMQEQFARAERIQGKAELLQDRGARLVQGARKVQRSTGSLLKNLPVLASYVRALT